MVNFYCIAWPFIRMMDPEMAHGFALKGLKAGIVPRPEIFNDPVLETKLWGLSFRTPIGMVRQKRRRPRPAPATGVRLRRNRQHYAAPSTGQSETPDV